MPFRIETERLLIREWRPADFEAFRAIATDPKVMRYIGRGDPWSDDQIHHFLSRQTENAVQLGFCLGALVFGSSGDLIGLAGLQGLGSTDEVEVGWWLSPTWWGRGLATEAGRALLGFAFGQAHVPHVVAIAHPENHASIRVMEKLGMSFRRRASGHELGLTQPDVEVVLYSLDAPE